MIANCPIDILYEIYSHVPVSEFGKCALSCKFVNKLLNNNNIWKQKCLVDFSLDVVSENYKQAYQSIALIKVYMYEINANHHNDFIPYGYISRSVILRLEQDDRENDEDKVRKFLHSLFGGRVLIYFLNEKGIVKRVDTVHPLKLYSHFSFGSLNCDICEQLTMFVLFDERYEKRTNRYACRPSFSGQNDLEKFSKFLSDHHIRKKFDAYCELPILTHIKNIYTDINHVSPNFRERVKHFIMFGCEFSRRQFVQCFEFSSSKNKYCFIKYSWSYSNGERNVGYIRLKHKKEI